MGIINTIIGLGASVMMPIIFFVVGLIFRMGIGKSFKAGMTVGVGFVGVNMVINLLLDNLGPASKAMVNRLGLHLTTVDVGWPTASTVGWGTPIMVATVVGFLVINAIMVFCNRRRHLQLLDLPASRSAGLCRHRQLLVRRHLHLGHLRHRAEGR